MNRIVKKILSSDHIAVAGVSRSRRKYGSIVFHNLKMKGYRVYPINPEISTFDGQTCYGRPSELPDGITSIVCVLKPETGIEIIRQAANSGITDVWLQPGAESDEILDWCRSGGINVVHGKCIMVESDFYKK